MIDAHTLQEDSTPQEDEASLKGLFLTVPLPLEASTWSRAAQHLLKPLSLLSLRRTLSTPRLPSATLLQPILDFRPTIGRATTANVNAAVAAVVSLRSFEEQSQGFIAGGRGTQDDDKLVHAQLARGFLRCFGSVFGLIQVIVDDVVSPEVIDDLQVVPVMALRSFFVHWQSAMRIVTPVTTGSAAEAEAVLLAIRRNLDYLGAELPYTQGQQEIPEQVQESINDCNVAPLITTAVAVTARQQHQPPRLIAHGPKAALDLNEPPAARVIVQPGRHSLDSLYALLNILCSSLETIPVMYDPRMVDTSDDPAAVVSSLALASERPLRLRLDISLLKMDLALSTAVELVRNAPQRPPKVPTALAGKRNRASMSSSRSRSMSRKAAPTASPSGSYREDEDTAVVIETPEDIEARLKRDAHDATVAMWESRAEESLASVIQVALEALGRGKKTVLTRESLLGMLLDQAQSNVDVAEAEAPPEEVATPASEASFSELSETSSSSFDQHGSATPLHAMLPLAARYFEWRIGRWEALGLKDSVRRDTYTRGSAGGVGDAWELLGVSFLAEFEQDELLHAGLEQDQLETWLDAIAEQERQRTAGKRRKSDQHKKGSK